MFITYALNWLQSHLALWGLFGTGFISATLLPAGSEAYFILMIHQGYYELWLLILIVTIGNTLGGMTNYLIGLYLPESNFTQNKNKNNKMKQRALNWIKRYGYPALFFSWLPLIGDFLCLAAGWLKFRWASTFLLIMFGKAVRYIFIAWLLF